MKTLLAIGDNQDWDSFNKFARQSRYFKNTSLNFKKVDYDSLLNCKLPKIDTKKIIVFFFFPFDYWDLKIETKEDMSVYGNRSYYHKFKAFWKKVKKKIEKAYEGHQIHYINPPEQLCIDRDKELTKRIVNKGGAQVSRSFSTRDYKKILKLLDQGKKLFIKVRFGSMGKGITYLEKNRWFTNFRYRRNKLVSLKADHGWSFIDVTNKNRFLKTLLKEDIIVEEAINPFLLKGRKFDLRLYVSFGKILYTYPRSNDCEGVTTNISQGAKGEKQSFLNRIPKKLLKEAESSAIKAAKAMKLNYAGVDIMPNSDGKSVTVIEVNTFPGMPKMKSYNISRYIIKDIAGQRW